MADLGWHTQLRSARERLGISRELAARKAGVPSDTLRRWEDGTRHPAERRLRALLTALDCPSAEANAILESAGYHSQHTLFPEERFPNYFYTVDELQTAVERVPWPEFVLNDRAEVVAANAAVQALWRVDYAWERAHRSAAQMNVMSVASDKQFADRVVNWEGVIGALIGAFKASPVQPRETDDPSDPYFGAVMAEFAAGDPTFLKRLIDAWQKTQPMDPKCRWTFPVVWEDEELGQMRFIDVVNTASEPDALAFNDWMPVDSETWRVLEQVKARGIPRAAG